MAKSLGVVSRSGTGKGYNRKLRSRGSVPAVLYGHGTDNLNIEIGENELRKFLNHLKSETELLTLDFQSESKEVLVLLKDLQYHPVTGRILHLDFFEINPDEELTVSVPIHFVGVPYGVREEGGLLEYLARDISISCLPRHLPAHLEVDISEVQLGGALHVGDATFPETIQILDDDTKALLSVVSPAQETAAEEEDGDAVGVAEVAAPAGAAAE